MMVSFLVLVSMGLRDFRPTSLSHQGEVADLNLRIILRACALVVT